MAWPVWIAALWWGSLTTLALGVVPLLFATLASPAMAGNMAARLFEVQTSVSSGLGLALLIAAYAAPDAGLAGRARDARVYVLGGVALALLAQCVVAPHIVARDNLRLWHAAGTAMYLAQWCCAAAVFWRMVRPERTPQP